MYYGTIFTVPESLNNAPDSRPAEDVGKSVSVIFVARNSPAVLSCSINISNALTSPAYISWNTLGLVQVILAVVYFNAIIFFHQAEHLPEESLVSILCPMQMTQHEQQMCDLLHADLSRSVNVSTGDDAVLTVVPADVLENAAPGSVLILK